MFSRPGKGTCAEYMVFKEQHDRAEALEEVPEEVLKEQLKNDLLGKEEDVFGAYLQDQMEKEGEELEQKKAEEMAAKKKEEEKELGPAKVNNSHGK